MIETMSRSLFFHLKLKKLSLLMTTSIYHQDLDPFNAIIKMLFVNLLHMSLVQRLHKNGRYVGGSDVEYSCIDDSKEIIGNNTVRCLYSGKWFNPPVFKDRQSSNNLLKIPLPSLISVDLSLLVVVIVVYVHRRHY